MSEHQVIVRNTCIIVTNYEKGESQTLEKNFQIWDPLTHKLLTFGMYYDKEHKMLYLPRGIDIWYVKKCVGVRDHSVENYNSYKCFNKTAKLKYSPRDDEQMTALQFMCGLTEEFEDNQYQPQLSVNLVTGKGKTYCSIATTCFFQLKTIVITGSTSLLNQWRANILDYTNFKDEDIFLMTGSSVMNMVIHDKSMRADRANIFLVTHATIRSYANTYGWDTLNDVFLHLGIGLKIIDEAHTNFENMLMLDFYTNVYKSYYVTATPKRSNKSENRIYQLFMKNIPDIDLFNSESDPHTDYIAIKWSSRPSPYIVSNCTNMYGLDRNKYIDYVTKNDNFYKMMYIVMDMVLKCKGRVLMYIGTNEGILRVYKFIGTNYPELLGDIGIFTSLLDKEHKLLERNKKILLSTTKSAGLGEHIEGLKMTIVVAEPFRSEVLARQSLGRTRDKDTTYIELVDLGFNAIKNFYYAKIPIFNKYALSTSDIYIDSYELENRYRRLKEERDEYISKCPLKLHDPRFFEYPKEEEFDIEAVRERFGLYDLKG